MLSYQHGYHAGNLADVHKHALLAWMLGYMTSKDKPLSYIETHAGRGLYGLDAAEAIKTGEAAAGIGRLADAFGEDHPYAMRLREARTRYGAAAYPGSPLIAALSLRPGDALHLCELHPGEHAALEKTMASFGARVLRKDGFAASLSLCPPEPRRGLMLVDPSWEVKQDYESVPRFVGAVRRKWNVGIVVLWYPVLTDGRHRDMLDRLADDHPDAFRHEVAFGPVRDGHRMVGSGLFVTRPPYGLADAASEVSAIFSGAGV